LAFDAVEQDDYELLAWLALDPGRYPGDEPARLAHLDYRDQGRILKYGFGQRRLSAPSFFDLKACLQCPDFGHVVDG